MLSRSNKTQDEREMRDYKKKPWWHETQQEHEMLLNTFFLPCHTQYKATLCVSADLAVRWLIGDRNMFARGPCFPEGHPIQFPRWNGPSHQQEQQAPGRSLDGWFQGLLLYHITRYRAVWLCLSATGTAASHTGDCSDMAWTLHVLKVWGSI